MLCSEQDRQWMPHFFAIDFFDHIDSIETSLNLLHYTASYDDLISRTRTWPELNLICNLWIARKVYPPLYWEAFILCIKFMNEVPWQYVGHRFFFRTLVSTEFIITIFWWLQPRLKKKNVLEAPAHLGLLVKGHRKIRIFPNFPFVSFPFII